MKVKHNGVMVDVCEKGCPGYACFWPRTDPGVFTQGQGYKSRGSGPAGWLCGTREIHGCPDKPVRTTTTTKEKL
jgi:hypothetical protein